MAVEIAQEITQKRRLAATNFAGNHRKSGIIHDAEFKHGETPNGDSGPNRSYRGPAKLRMAFREARNNFRTSGFHKLHYPAAQVGGRGSRTVGCRIGINVLP